MVSFDAIVLSGAAQSAISASTVATLSAKVLGEVIAEHGSASKYGAYAGAPWPFREDRKKYSVIGGPIVSLVDGKLKIASGTPLEIVEGHLPMNVPNSTPIKPLSHDWTVMDGSLWNMSMIRRGVMMGVNDVDEIWYFAKGSWANVDGRLKNISAAEDGTVLGINKDQNLWMAQKANGSFSWLIMDFVGKMQQIGIGIAMTFAPGVASKESSRRFLFASFLDSGAGKSSPSSENSFSSTSSMALEIFPLFAFTYLETVAIDFCPSVPAIIFS